MCLFVGTPQFNRGLIISDGPAKAIDTFHVLILRLIQNLATLLAITRRQNQ
jgi:hypothetical protein